MADMHGYEWLIGGSHALDPTKFFVISTEMFGNGRSSSPSNTAEPLRGRRFPSITIRDNVEAVHRLLTQELRIRHLRAVVGFSMGAQQAFQWGVSYPDFMDRIVATSGTAKTYGHGFVRLEGQIAALTVDASFEDGDYTKEPSKGIQATSIVWGGWLFSQQWWHKELWKELFGQTATFDQVVGHYRNLFIDDDANDLLLQMRMWQKHDISGTQSFHGDIEAALRSIKIPVLYMPSETDLYFPLSDAQYEASFIPRCTLSPIPSLWGHTAGAGFSEQDSRFVNERVGLFMN